MDQTDSYYLFFIGYLVGVWMYSFWGGIRKIEFLFLCFFFTEIAISLVSSYLRIGYSWTQLYSYIIGVYEKGHPYGTKITPVRKHSVSVRYTKFERKNGREKESNETQLYLKMFVELTKFTIYRGCFLYSRIREQKHLLIFENFLIVSQNNPVEIK